MSKAEIIQSAPQIATIVSGLVGAWLLVMTERMAPGVIILALSAFIGRAMDTFGVVGWFPRF